MLVGMLMTIVATTKRWRVYARWLGSLSLFAVDAADSFLIVSQ